MKRIFLRWLVSWMDRQYNRVELPDGTHLARMSPEFHDFVYHEGWGIFCDRTGKDRGAYLQ